MVKRYSYESEMDTPFNHIYSTIRAHFKYRRAKQKLPPHHDHWSLATYAKNNYNTNLGKATPEKYYEDYRRLVLA